MAEVFIGVVKQMVIFLVAGQTILRFGMGKAYERYIKLIISLMVIAQFISALAGFFSFGREKELWANEERLVISFEERWAANIEDFERRLKDKQQEFEEEWENGAGYPDLAGEEGATDTLEGALTDSEAENGQIMIEEIKIQ